MVVVLEMAPVAVPDAAGGGEVRLAAVAVDPSASGHEVRATPPDVPGTDDVGVRGCDGDVRPERGDVDRVHGDGPARSALLVDEDRDAGERDRLRLA